jgi:hypothetical protein
MELSGPRPRAVSARGLHEVRGSELTGSDGCASLGGRSSDGDGAGSVAETPTARLEVE